jgi:hypothetical protein
MIFFILSISGLNLILYVDYLGFIILIGFGLLSSFVINGYELKRATKKRYAELSSGYIYHNYKAISNLKLIPRYISKISAKFKISISNISRKKKLFYKIMLLITLSLSSILIMTIGGMIVGNTIKNQIAFAQGNGTIIIGHKDVINHYSLRYEGFTNNNIEFTNTENLIQTEYLFNATSIEDLEARMVDWGEIIEYWDKRLFLYTYAQEVDGLIINIPDDISGDASYTVVGQDRTGVLPFMGIEFKEYIEKWEFFGTIGNESNSIIVGDTLASSFFDYAVVQSIDILANEPNVYNVTGILYDSFCSGNASYLRLESLQSDLNLTGMINLAVVGVNINANKTELINALKSELINIGLGENFSVIDITDIFEMNLNSIDQIYITTLILVIFQISIIIWALNQYQRAVFQDRIRDLSILRAIGVKRKFLKDVIFYEDVMIFLISSAFSFGLSLFFSIFLLGQTAILPPIVLVILLWLIITLIIVIIRRISIEINFRDINQTIIHDLKNN